MCTLVILRRADHPWPLIVGGNRDEMASRKSLPPGRHWQDNSRVTAGLDCEAGGTWMGVNDEGLLATVMNREGTLGRVQGKRSRGEIVLDVLKYETAAEAALALARTDARGYRAFNLFFADARNAYWARYRESGAAPRPEVFGVPEGLSMLTAHELNDFSVSRIAEHLPLFAAASAPDPQTGAYSEWETLLGRRVPADTDDLTSAMTFTQPNGFQTVSSSLIALPRTLDKDHRIIWRYADGPPDTAPFEPVTF